MVVFLWKTGVEFPAVTPDGRVLGWLFIFSSAFFSTAIQCVVGRYNSTDLGRSVFYGGLPRAHQNGGANIPGGEN
jgi:hypothetical protein